MAKFFLNGKWKKRTVTALSVALSLTLSLGIVTACSSGTTNDEEEEEDVVSSETDTQIIKNGNFEFFSEKDEKLDDKRALINTPTSWTFTTGSPTSDTASGIISTDSEEWDSLTKSTKTLVDWTEDDSAKTIIAYAVAHWDEASIYDRLEFLDTYSVEIADLDSNSDAAKLFAEYDYTVTFSDVKSLRDELGETVLTHYADTDEQDVEDNNLLMIHNSRTSDSVVGTAQYYTSSTTVTLEAGTAAKVSVWVKTTNLTHYYSDNPVEVTANAGAYIGVTHTVGGTTLDAMRIKNINTQNVTTNNGWAQYTLYVRASTFATSTFKIVLGLGLGDTSNRYEQVNGYAFFDDLECEIMTSADYVTAVKAANVYYDDNAEGTFGCGLDSVADKKIFDATNLEAKFGASKRTYALDLYAGFDELKLGTNDFTAELTKEVSGSKSYTSENAGVYDNRYDGTTAADKQSAVGMYSYTQLETLAQNNGYFTNVFKNDFQKDGKSAFPFDGSMNNDQIILLLSTNGAAYTATVKSATSDATGAAGNAFTVEPETRMLVSFFVKTSEIRSGKSGATVTLVDGDNETTISAFDSTSVATVDIDDDTTDIYNGWVQCFFFVENTTQDVHSFYLKLSYGPTSVADTTKSDYLDGYAAFTNFQTKTLTKTQYGYASTGTYAQTVSLTGSVNANSQFDSAAITSDIENGFAKPVNFFGVQSGSIRLVSGGNDDKTPDELATEDNLYTGLLNAEYAETYMQSDLAQMFGGTSGSAAEWWSGIFGDSAIGGRVANQPLVILNAGDSETTAYGYLLRNINTIAADSYQKISMRVKLSVGAVANIYLIDTSDVKAGYNNPLAPLMGNVVYWYDDEGNITYGDPSDDDFNARTDIAYYLQSNGLYTKESDPADGATYYANLSNYDADDDGNLVTTDGTIAYYYNDGKYYAYYDKTTKAYSQVVNNLPDSETGDNEKSIVRYTAADMSERGSVITVVGTAENAGKWVEVSFYIHTGSESKSYRLEVWAGYRDQITANENGDLVTAEGKGIPAGGYVFFDAYSNASDSTYDSILADMIDLKKDAYNKDLDVSDEKYLGSDDKFPDSETYALYYTFTFYDSKNYLRYDVNNDEDGLGNPYGSYKQSAYDETLIYFDYSDNGELNGSPVSALFYDFSAYDVAVAEDDLGADTDDSSTSTDTSGENDTNFWLLLSSALLAVALLFAIIAVLVRRLVKKYGKPRAPKNKKKNKNKDKAKKQPKLEIVPDEPEKETKEDDKNEPSGPYAD